MLNRYYRITRFYTFIKDTSIKGALIIGSFIILVAALELFFLDFDAILNTITTTYSPGFIFSLFLVSEAIMGLIPPEIFIAWASKSVNPWLFLGILASMSYIGGLLSYFLGTLLCFVPSVKNYLEIKIAKHIKSLRKWGGLFVFIGAMLPIPHSVVSLACGLINYKLKHYLLWALFRFVRFALYAFVIFRIF